MSGTEVPTDNQERLQHTTDSWHLLKEGGTALLTGHVQHIGKILAVVLNLQGFRS